MPLKKGSIVKIFAGVKSTGMVHLKTAGLLILPWKTGQRDSLSGWSR